MLAMKRILETVKSKFTLIYALVLMVFAVIFGGNQSNSDFAFRTWWVAFGEVEYVIQLVLIVFNVVLLYLSEVSVARGLLLFDVVFISIFQQNVWMTLAVLLVVGIAFAVMKRIPVSRVRSAIAVQLVACLMITALVSVICNELTVGKEFFRSYSSPDGEYVIITNEWNGIAGEDSSYFVCSSGDDVYLLYFRLQKNEVEKYYFDIGDDVRVEWLSNTQFKVGDTVYQVPSEIKEKP